MPKSYASGLVPASADAVWGIVRDYNGMPGWHPGDRGQRDRGRRLRPGGRLCAPVDAGRRWLGRRTAPRDRRRRAPYTYEFTDAGPFPVRSYRSTISVAPVTATGQAFVEWSAWFDADAGDEAQLTTTFADVVFAAGIAALGECFGG